MNLYFFKPKSVKSKADSKKNVEIFFSNIIKIRIRKIAQPNNTIGYEDEYFIVFHYRSLNCFDNFLFAKKPLFAVISK
jgi:hypothetical protein